MAGKTVHVVACADRWAVEEEGTQVSLRDTLAQAEQIARALATGAHAELVIHDRDGGIARHDSYRNGDLSRRGEP